MQSVKYCFYLGNCVTNGAVGQILHFFCWLYNVTDINFLHNLNSRFSIGVGIGIKFNYYIC